jgi:hypothetical protein
VHTSVQQNYNVDLVFQYLAAEFLKRRKEREAQAPRAPSAAGDASPTGAADQVRLSRV